MNDNKTGLLLGAFTADSLALGAHWVYDTNIIDERYGRVTDLLDPISVNFHPNRKAGEFTHYGDQMLLFYNNLRETGEFIPSSYLKRWADFIENYNGYIDHAMQDSLQNLRKGKTPSGSGSSDLSGVLYTPVFMALYDETDLKEHIDTAVRMTHNNDAVVQTAKLLADILTAVLSGVKPVEAIKSSAENESLNPFLKSLINSGLESINRETRDVIAEFGQSCSINFGLPSAIHVIGRYENDLETGLIENVMAGGDSAARGIFAGAVLGAYCGFSQIPERWLQSLQASIILNL